MKWTCCPIASLVMLGCFACYSAAQSPASAANTGDIVWIWSSNCDGRRHLAITVHHGGKALYHSIVPICRGNRESEDGRAEFEVPQSLVSRDTSGKAEADIWQASGDTDALILGFSLAGRKRISLNTLFVAQLDKRVSAKLGHGLSMTTYPVPSFP